MQLGDIESNEGTLTELLARVSDTVRRRWIVLLAVTAAVLVAGFILISTMTPKYVATAKVRLDPRSAISADAQQARAELAPEAIETELTAVRSDDLARSVVRSLGLADDAEFTSGLNASPKESLANSSTREGAVVNALLGRLDVSREKLTYVVNISFNSVDPVKAASIANAFASGYIESAARRVSGATEPAGRRGAHGGSSRGRVPRAVRPSRKRLWRRRWHDRGPAGGTAFWYVGGRAVRRRGGTIDPCDGAGAGSARPAR
jgi:succinoglycan biosynthesis transport protein ExoP